MAAQGSANRGCTWACWPGSAGRCCAPQSMGLSCKAAAQPATTQASGPAVKMDGANSPAQCVPESKAPSAASAVTGKAPGPRAATPAEPSEGTLGVEEGKCCQAAEAPGCWVIISGGSFCPNAQLCLSWKSGQVEPTPAWPRQAAETEPGRSKSQ